MKEVGYLLVFVGLGCLASGIYLAIYAPNNLFLFPAVASGYLIREGYRAIKS